MGAGNTEALNSVGKRRVRLAGRFFPQGSSAIVNSSNLGSKGWTVTRTALGQFTLAIVDPWLRVAAKTLGLQMSAPSLYKLEWGAVDVSSAKTAVINCIACSAVGWEKQAADGAAGNATSEMPMGRLEGSIPIGHVFYLVPGAALTANDTNYATITIYKRTAGGGSTAIAQITTKITGGSGNWTAFLPIALTTTIAAAEGDSISFDIAKAGTGVVVPVFALTASGRQDIAANAANSVSFDLEMSQDTVTP